MILILATVFIATLAVAVLGYVLVNRRTLATADVARDRLRPDAPEKTWRLLKDERTSDLPFIDRLLSGKEWSETLRLNLQRAGSSTKPGTFLLIAATCGMIGMLAARLVESRILGIVLMAVGWSLPYLWIKRKQRKRLAKFEEQLPDAIDMLVSAMRAGYSFQAATQFIGDEMIDPVAEEFARFYEEQRLGIDVRAALLGMQTRIDSLDLKMFVTAVVIQRETGGNLSEVLSGLADLVRQRMAMKGHIQTLVAEPKISAKFLAALPVIVFGILSVVNPRFIEPLVVNPGGRLALMAAAGGVIAGYMIMMKIADVDI